MTRDLVGLNGRRRQSDDDLLLYRRRRSINAPTWVLVAGGVAASTDLDYVNNLAWNKGLTTIPALLSCARNLAVSYYTKADGSLIPFSANVLRYGSAGLLLEEQRINLVMQSQPIHSGAVWFNSGLSFADNNGLAPNGNTEASLLTISATTVNHYTEILAATPVVAATNYTYIAYSRYNGSQRYISLIGVGSANTDWFAATFDLLGGTVTKTGFGATGTFVAAKIIPVINGGYRIELTGAHTGIVSRYTLSYNSTATPTYGISGLESYLGDGASNFYLWGCQQEQGSSGSSYISTNAVAVTRPADVITGLPAIVGDFTDYIQLGNAQDAAVVLGAGATTTLVTRVSSTQVKATDGTTTVTATVGSGNTSVCKIAVARQGNSIKLCANAGTVASGTLASLDVSSNQYGKSNSGSVIGIMNILRHARFAAFLSDANMQSLTT